MVITGNCEPGADEFLSSTKHLILEIVKTLVDQPDAVSVELISDGTYDTLRLRLAPGDVSKLIAKNARTINSIRTIVSAAGLKAQRRLAVEVDRP